MSEDIILNYLIPIGGPLVLLWGGWLVLRSRKESIENRLTFTEEFREKFIQYCNDRGNDQTSYDWLMFNSNRMQNEMGVFGFYKQFSPPFANYMISNYPIVLNMLPELQRYFGEHRHSGGMLFASQIDGYAKGMDSALLRYIGSLNTWHSTAIQNLRNPFQWLRIGVEQILSFPILFLSWFKIFGSNSVDSLQGNIVFRLIAALATLTGLVASAMAIILGYEQTIILLGFSL